MRLQLPDGTSVALHDEGDPLGEARRQLAVVSDERPSAVAIVGAGLGFLTEAARHRWPDATILVLEPLRQLADAARVRTPALYATGRVRVVTGPDYEGSGELWRVFDTPEAAGVRPPIVVHPILMKAMPGPMMQAMRVARRAIDAARMNATAREENAGRYVLNTLRNAAHIVNGGDPERLRGGFHGMPVVVVGAGPSLDRNLADLRSVAGRALIIATDTSWRPLVAAGVDPHLVIALDPTTANGRHLTGVPLRRDSWVIAEGSVDPDALAPLVGRVAMFRVGAHHPWPWLQSLGIERPVVRAWGSVLTSALDLAIICDCDPVVFVGSDLSFTDDRPYCRGTSMEDDWARHAARGVSLRRIWSNTLSARPLLQEPGLDGNAVATSSHLIEFRNWLVAHAGETASGRVLNATGAGILMGAGVEQVDLVSTLEAHPDRDDEIRARLRGLLTPTRSPSASARLMEALDEIQAPAGALAVTPPVADWLTFGRPSLTVADLHAAATAGRAAVHRAGRERPPGADLPSGFPAIPPSRWYAADRVAAMRALLTGDESVLEGTSPRAALEDTAGHGAATERADHAIAALLALPHVATGVGEDIANGASAAVVPFSCRFLWSEAAAPLVAALEEDLVRVGVCARPGGAEPSTPVGDFWTGPIVPLPVSASQALTPTSDVDVAARLALVAAHLTLVHASTSTDPLEQRCVARLAAAIEQGLSQPNRLTLSAGLTHVRAYGRRATMALPLRVDAFMRALTGTVAYPSDDAEPRLGLARGGVAYCEPVVLTDGLPRGWSVTTAPGERAMFTPRGWNHSVFIDANGHTEAAPAWPSAITGEHAWGADGGSLAWNADTSMVFLRERDGAAPLGEVAPFVPRQMTLGLDGSPFWLDTAGALWEWRPGHVARFIAVAPEAGLLRLDGSDLVLAPTARDDRGLALRRRLYYEWWCDGTPHGRHERATRSEGQCAKVAHGPWTARSHPFADLIRLEHADGRVLLLACHAPVGVAWAGPSLVVTTGAGDALYFPRLADRLASLDPGPGFALRQDESTR